MSPEFDDVRERHDVVQQRSLFDDQLQLPAPAETLGNAWQPRDGHEQAGSAPAGQVEHPSSSKANDISSRYCTLSTTVGLGEGGSRMIDEICTADEWGPEKVVLVRDEALGMQGALVIDNTSRGPGKGGTRMRPSLTINEVARLARVMTWKWAAADLRFGGAKAGLRFDPKSADKELALRRFARALASEVPREYMFGLDMGLTEVDAAILQDELGTVDAATGGPSALGGVPYDAWGVTGHGVAASAIQAMAFAGRAVDGARVVVQGFGAVGAATAARLHGLGASIISVSTADGAILDQDGLDVPGAARGGASWATGRSTPPARRPR